MSKIDEITSDVFKSEVLESDKPVVVDFWAPWCGPCRMVAPVLEEISQKMNGKIKFVKLNTDENQKTAMDYQIMAIPSLLIFKDGQEVVGSRTRVKVVKNKVAPPFKEAEFDIIYGEGISTVGDLLDMAVHTEVIDKSGVWYSFDNERIGHGRESAKTFLKERPDATERIVEKLRAALGLAHKATNGSGAAPVHPEKAGIK